ncbi:MAG: hypothetical protein K2Q25_14360, partial [Mycobacteriaceae bacterium]|nr:hypothetical protein [Mycobacteriaceae bacterium]
TDLSRESAQRLQEDPLYRGAHDWFAGFAALLDEYDRTVPSTGAWTESHREFYRYLNSVTQQMDGVLLPETFSARGYIGLLDALLARLKEFRITETELRRVPTMAEEARTSLALECLGAKAFAALVWPVMPDLGQQIWDWLGLPGQPIREAEWSFLPC